MSKYFYMLGLGYNDDSRMDTRMM